MQAATLTAPTVGTNGTNATPHGNGKPAAKGAHGASKPARKPGKPATVGAKKGKTNGNAQGKGGKVATGKAGPAPKTGLRRPQIAILTAVCKAKGPLSRAEIAAKSGVDPTKIGDYADQAEVRTPEAEARYPFPCLRKLGYVSVDVTSHPRRYVATARGRAAFVKLPK